MKSLKLIAAMAICSMFIIGVQKSDAVETTVPVAHEPIVIEELRSYNYSSTEYDYYNSGYFTFYIQTDRPFSYIFWFVDDVLEGMSQGDGTQTDTYFSFSNLPGEIKGKKYKIEARAWPLEPGNFLIDTETYDFTVVTPVIREGYGPNTGAWGYVEISSFYYNGSHIIMSSSAYAYNPENNPEAKDPTDNPLRVSPWFRTQEFPAPDGAAGNEHRDTKDPEIIGVGETSDSYSPGPFTDPDPGSGGGAPFDRFVGNLGDEEVYYNAHTHLMVSTTKGLTKQDHWEVDTQEQTGTAAVTFTGTDGP